jgi:VanZ family protein
MKKNSFHLFINILFPFTGLLIMLFSLLSDLPLQPPSLPFFDKLEHGTAYFVLAGLGYFFFYLKKTFVIRGIIFSVLLCTIWGALLEFLQSFTGRTPELFDGIMNFIGSLAGALVALLLQKKYYFKYKQ